MMMKTTSSLPARQPAFWLVALVSASTLGATLSAGAAEYTRATNAAAAGNWSDITKWTPGTNYPQTLADAALLNSGATNRVVTLDDTFIIGLLGIGYSNTSGAKTGNITLQGSGESLTVGAVGTPGFIYVGAGASTVSSSGLLTGTLNLGTDATLNLLGASSAFYIGGHNGNAASGAASTNGTVMLEPNAALNLGASGARSEWHIGRQTALTGVSTGRFSASGGSVNAFLSVLTVGQNLRGSSSPETHRADGELDATGLANATINTTALVIGRAQESTASGVVRLGNGHTLSVGDSVEVGVRAGGAPGTGNAVATGTLELQAGATVAFGTEENRASLTFGRNAGQRGDSLVAEGVFTAAGGSAFSGYFSSITLGAQQTVASGKTFRATGILDLHLATVTAFDVSGNVTIGYHDGEGEGSHGQLKLPKTSGRIGGNLWVGDSETGGGSQASSSGLLALEGTHLSISGNVTLGTTGRVHVQVNGESAGLRLAADSLLSIATPGTGLGDANAGYTISFHDPADPVSEPYYGFAWEGEHTEAVQLLVSNFFITWDNQMSSLTPGVYYDPLKNLTYIGVNPIPEPSVVGLALLGVLGSLGVALHRKRH